MKKILLILTILAGATISSKGQHFVASFGVTHSWGVPSYVNNVIYNDYYGYDWVHASRIVRGGCTSFDVILQRGDVFVEVNIGRGGYIHRTRHYDRYPLHDHVCGQTCGYHSNYYSTYYSTCNSNYHRGHNHVVYRSRPVYTYNNVYYNKPYRNGYHKKRHGYYKNNGHSAHKKHNYSDQRSNTNSRATHSSSLTRRGRNYDQNKYSSRSSRSDGNRNSRSDSQRATYKERRDTRSGSRSR